MRLARGSGSCLPTLRPRIMEQLPSWWYQLLWQRQPGELLTVPFSLRPKWCLSFLSMFIGHSKSVDCAWHQRGQSAVLLCAWKMESWKCLLKNTVAHQKIVTLQGGRILLTIGFFFFLMALESENVGLCKILRFLFPLYYLWLILMTFMGLEKKYSLLVIDKFHNNRKLFIFSIYLLIFLFKDLSKTERVLKVLAIVLCFYRFLLVFIIVLHSYLPCRYT